MGFYNAHFHWTLDKFSIDLNGKLVQGSVNGIYKFFQNSLRKIYLFLSMGLYKTLFYNN